MLSQNYLLCQRRYSSEQLAQKKTVVGNAQSNPYQSNISFPFAAVPSMLAVARLVEILMSAYFAPAQMPLLNDLIMRDSIEEQELHISEVMHDNIMRLGTTFCEGQGMPPGQEDSTTRHDVESIEKVFIDIIKNKNVFASNKGGANTDFQEATAADWKDDATKPRAFIKTTCAASPATISLFVSMACKDGGEQGKTKRTKVLAPCYIVQPNVNVRDLSSGARLDERTGQIATALGRTQYDLSTHEMQACLYTVVVEEAETGAIGKREDHSRLLPMVSTGFPPGTGQETLCGSPRAKAAAVHDVDMLWFTLFGQKRVDCVEVTESGLNDVEQATVIFNALIGRLSMDYDGFKNVSHWMRLHRRLREVMWKDIAMEYQPTNERELYHEVRVMLQAFTPLRIAMLDGLGRIGGAVYALLGRLLLLGY
jgi:hypothetical protein